MNGYYGFGSTPYRKQLVSIVDHDNPGKSLDIPAGSIVIPKSEPTYCCPNCGDCSTAVAGDVIEVVIDGEDQALTEYQCQDCGQAFWI